MKQTNPVFESEAAERFVATADLSEFDLSGLVPARFTFLAKSATVNIRLPKPLLDAVKERARARTIPYTRFIREAVELALGRPDKV